MALYSKESLENLKKKVDLVEVITTHARLKRSGSTYKGLCPFHEEKTPSFMIQAGGGHYHCFGCGAHGDAIAFLMNYLQLSFTEAVESLAEKFGVTLEKISTGVPSEESNKKILKEAVETAHTLYHYLLFHAEEAKEALSYLHSRGISDEFIRKFELGYAPKTANYFRPYMHGKQFLDPILEKAGLISVSEEGRRRDFFSDRITFPIRDSLGSVIGFSARKYREETFGGKYINSPETPLFKKSHLLFGLSYSRRRIAKERQALLVEGQVDALHLIDQGLDYTVAGQGTAFGEGQVQELMRLGILRLFLALDGDAAGHEAMVKIGSMFQKEGVDVYVLLLPPGEDPDSLIRKEGIELFKERKNRAISYLEFFLHHFSTTLGNATPAAKTEIVRLFEKEVRSWNHPVMVHESLKKGAELLGIPPSVFGISRGSAPFQKVLLQKTDAILSKDAVLETDVLRWLFLADQERESLDQMAKEFLKPTLFKIPLCQRLYEVYTKEKERPTLLSMAGSLESKEEESLLKMIIERKSNFEKSVAGLKESIQALLTREWMEVRKEIHTALQEKGLSEEREKELSLRLSTIIKNPPRL